MSKTPDNSHKITGHIVIYRANGKQLIDTMHYGVFHTFKEALVFSRKLPPIVRPDDRKIMPGCKYVQAVFHPDARQAYYEALYATTSS